MKKYNKPAMSIYDINIESNILTLSDPTDVAGKGLGDYNSGHSMLAPGRRNTILDDDEEDW